MPATDDTLIRRLRQVMHSRAGEAAVPGGPRSAGLRARGDAITPKDDAFHFQDYADHSNRLFYVEWWYYNFQDPATGLSGMVTFAICNPGDELGLGTASLNMAVMRPGSEVVTRIDFLHCTHFSASAERADVTVGESSVEVVDADTYRIRARTADGTMDMDLTYRRGAPAQLLANNVPGYAAWEVSSWLVYMPVARVDGALTVEGNRITLDDAKGYHDHDWGMWMLPERVWSWAQFATDDRSIAFDVGFHAAFQKSTAYLRWSGHDLYFPQEQFTVRQHDFETWWHFWEYPRKIDFEAVDASGAYLLRLSWTVGDTATLWKYPLIVFEQSCAFNGTLHARDPATRETGEVLAEIATTGFCEYTNRWIGGSGDA